MYDETQLKIMDATMTLIIEKGYSKATTKEIARLAGVNECTIFRRFEGKKVSEMISAGVIKEYDTEGLALQFISMNFGFVFLDASFGDALIGISREDYIKNSVDVFIKGIQIG